jgi:APA family basic amino acid/polyamine antiporter
MEQPTKENLVRGIRRWDLVAILLNAIIGAGIFGLPSKVYGHVGAYSLFAFIACALLIGLIILCFAEVSSRFEETGGTYLYARAAFGPVIGFEIGWLIWLQRLMAFAAISNVLIAYVSFLWPAAGSGVWRAVIITTITASICLINIRSVRGTALAIDVFTICKLASVLLFVLLGLLFIEPRNYSFQELPSLGEISASMLLVVFAFAGIDVAVVSAGEIDQPRRNLPFAMFTALGVATLVYTLIQLVCIGTLPDLAASEKPLADAGSRFLGSVGASAIAVGAIISSAGALTTVGLAAPRSLFALAEQRQFPRLFSTTHRRYHTPHMAILLSSAAMIVVSIFGTFVYALKVNAMIGLINYTTVCLAMPILRRKSNVRPAMFTVPGGGLISAAALIVCLWVLTNSTWVEARDLGLAAAAGLLIYIFYRQWQRRSSDQD